MTETLPPKAGKPIWPKVPAGFVRSVLAGHSSLGLAFAALIYVVCITGTVAVFAREFERWERADSAVITSVSAEAVQTAMTEAVARAKQGADHMYLVLPTPELPRFLVTAEHDGHNEMFLADAEGHLTSTDHAVWTEFMTNLHIRLHLPSTWGMFVVGLTGVALLSSLISGVLAHPRVFKDAFHLRWGGSKRLQEADLHNRLGVWALPFHVIVSTTGALLGLTTIIVGVLALAVFQGDINKAYDLFLPPHPKDDPRPAAALPNLVAALEQTARLSPGSTPIYVGLEHPKEQGQGVLVNATVPGRLANADSYSFDGKGELLPGSKVGEMVLGEKILGSLGPLHFGWFGGLAIKVLYGLLGLALSAVTSSGVAIWLARRRDKGRPAPRWERVWIATVWSQPAALAASALAIVALAPHGAVLPLVVWLAATVLSLAAAGFATVRALSVGLRLAAAGLTVLTVAGHLVRHGASYADPMAWGVNAALIALAAVLAATVWRSKPKVA